MFNKKSSPKSIPSPGPTNQGTTDPDKKDDPVSLAQKANLLKKKEKPKGLPIGYLFENTREPLYYYGDRHLVTFGPTGSGKNTTSQTPVLLEDDASAFVIDVKGQLAAITARRRCEMGHDVCFINPFEVLGIPSATYNPLEHIDPNSVTFVADCRRIAEGLVEQVKGDHWEKSALDLVEILIMWTIQFGEDKSLITVRKILNKPERERREFLMKIAGENIKVISEGAMRYTSDSKEVRDCIQTAVVQLNFLRDPAVERILGGGQGGISFAKLKKEYMTVFVIIPPELLYTYGRFLRLVFLSAFGELIREKNQPDKPVLFILDEFAQLGQMSIVENAAAIVRDYKMRLWIILQNLPQLEAMYDRRWESFISSAGLVQGFTPNDLKTAHFFSNRSGTKKDYRENISSSSSGGAGGMGFSTGTSYQEVEVPYYKNDFIFDLDESQQLLINAGSSTILNAYRVKYFENELYKKTKLFDDDPYHMSNEDRTEFERRARSREWPAGGPGNRIL